MAFSLHLDGIPSSGTVVRGTVPAKRSGTLEHVFVLERSGASVEETARRHIDDDAVVVDSSEFETSGDADIAILYSRVLPEGAPGGSSLIVSGGVPEGVPVDGPMMDEAEFFSLVHDADSVALERGATTIARRVARMLPAERIPEFWARQDYLLRVLAEQHPQMARGTDSFLYWSLAVLFGNRDPLNERPGARRLEFTDREEETAERFASLSEQAYFIRTERRVAFYRGAEETIEADPTPIDMQDAGSLVGFYFVGHDDQGVRSEFAGIALWVRTYPTLDSLGLDARVRSLAAKSGITVDELLASDTGTEMPIYGLGFISFVPRKGSQISEKVV